VLPRNSFSLRFFPLRRQLGRLPPPSPPPPPPPPTPPPPFFLFFFFFFLFFFFFFFFCFSFFSFGFFFASTRTLLLARFYFFLSRRSSSLPTPRRISLQLRLFLSTPSPELFLFKGEFPLVRGFSRHGTSDTPPPPPPPIMATSIRCPQIYYYTES